MNKLGLGPVAGGKSFGWPVLVVVLSLGFALLQPRSKSTRRQSRLESEVRAGRRQLCQTAQHETARFKSYRLGRILAKPLSDDVGIYEMLNLEEATEQRGRQG